MEKGRDWGVGRGCAKERLGSGVFTIITRKEAVNDYGTEPTWGFRPMDSGSQTPDRRIDSTWYYKDQDQHIPTTVEARPSIYPLSNSCISLRIFATSSSFSSSSSFCAYKVSTIRIPR